MARETHHYDVGSLDTAFLTRSEDVLRTSFGQVTSLEEVDKERHDLWELCTSTMWRT